MILFEALGQRWALRIMWELREQRLSFRQLRSRCDEVSPTSLNRRLKELRELDLIDHQDSGFGHTALGQELGEQLLQMHHWAEHWQQRRQKPESS